MHRATKTKTKNTPIDKPKARKNALKLFLTTGLALMGIILISFSTIQKYQANAFEDPTMPEEYGCNYDGVCSAEEDTATCGDCSMVFEDPSTEQDPTLSDNPYLWPENEGLRRLDSAFVECRQEYNDFTTGTNRHCGGYKSMCNFRKKCDACVITPDPLDKNGCTDIDRSACYPHRNGSTENECLECSSLNMNRCDDARPFCETNRNALQYGNCVECQDSSHCAADQYCALGQCVSTPSN
ncbi:MAG TPA: hypothetical protein VIT68_03690 [Candidatus Gracilibacteria bacterium]